MYLQGKTQALFKNYLSLQLLPYFMPVNYHHIV